MSEARTSFGAMLRQLRSAATLSQEELAERAGLSRRGISDLERGLRQAPRLETVRLLADALVLGDADRTALLAAARPALWERASTAAGSSAAALPVPLTPLIGREMELAALRHMLAGDHVRLVTITGPGGVGKTRLALAVAEQFGGTLPDGVWFVDLSPLDDPSLVAPAVGGVLGVREGEVTAPRLSTVLGDKRLLLVLDNFERVVEAAPLVADILALSPGCKVLVTSRIPLHAYGEQEYPLAPLPLPDPAHLPPLEHLTQLASVRLFVARAQSVKPDFTVTPDNAPAVAEICSRLDGLPLAIELAAARIKVLPPQALLKRLKQRLPLLTGGARTLPVRQQTMRDAIAWSHDLLSPEEQTVFRRLAVFPGGCTIEAAETVAGAGADAILHVFGTLAALVDASLLRQEEGAEGEPRFRMLETVREYALEQLEARSEAEEIRQRLTDWCLALAEQAEPAQFFGDISLAGMLRLEEELPNLRTAVNWLLAQGETTRALRLLVAAEDFWTQRHVSDGELHGWLEAALATAPDAPVRDRTLAHWLLSIGNRVLGHDEAALRHAQRLLDAAEASGEAASLGIAHVALALTWEDRGNSARAAAAYAEAIPLLRLADGDDGFALYVQAALADKLILQGDCGSGVPMLGEALMRLRQLPEPPWTLVNVINMRGFAALLQNDLPLAARLFAESIERGRSLHHSWVLLGAMAGLAGVALAQGQAERAARLLGAIEATRASVGMRRTDHWIHAERIVADTRAALPAADLEQAWSAGRAVPLDEAVTEALTIADEVTIGAPDRATMVAAAQRPVTTGTRQKHEDRYPSLPVPLTPLIGREQAILAAVALLTQPTIRLLTLTGPGGIGKTRLALQVAADTADAFLDGVVFVSLASITDPDLVALAIAQALGVQETSDAPVAERLAAFLRTKQVLLVLDNFEQVVEAAPLVADLLAACPGLTALVTSRVRLRLSGEQEYSVPSLTLPSQAEDLTSEVAIRSEAVHLFVRRAQAVQDDFALADQNAASDRRDLPSSRWIATGH